MAEEKEELKLEDLAGEGETRPAAAVPRRASGGPVVRKKRLPGKGSKRAVQPAPTPAAQPAPAFQQEAPAPAPAAAPAPAEQEQEQQQQQLPQKQGMGARVRRASLKLGQDLLAKQKEAHKARREQVAQKKEIARQIRRHDQYYDFREGVLYILFLLLFLLVTVLSRGGEDVYFYTAKMRELVVNQEFREVDVPNYDKTFDDVVTIDDVWYFLQGPLVNSLFQEEWYNGDAFEHEELGNVLSYNRLLGGARLRQLRVEEDTCDVRAEYRSVIKYCYGEFSSDHESKGGFGPVLNADDFADGLAYEHAYALFDASDNATHAAATCFSGCDAACADAFGADAYKYEAECDAGCASACGCMSNNDYANTTLCADPRAGQASVAAEFTHTWQTADALDELSYWGVLQLYPGSGYVTDLPVNRTESAQMLQQLKEDKYIDLGTRALLVDFTVYNAFLKLYNVVRLSFEFPATGGVIPKQVYRAVKIERYPEFSFVVFLECCLLLCVGYFVVVELREILRHRLAYFSSVWKVADMLNLVLWVAVIILRLYTVDVVYGTFGVATRLSETRGTEYPQLQSVAAWMSAETNLNAVNAWLMWFKTFKYCTISKRMSFLLRIMARASANIFFFMVMFFIFFVGFAQAGYLAFSVDIDNFRTFGHSLLTLFRSVVGDLDYEQLSRANRVYGPIFYILFYVVVLLVLLNVFLAILGDAYGEVRREDEAEGVYEEPGVSIMDLINKLRGKNDRATIDAALELADQTTVGQHNIDAVLDRVHKHPELQDATDDLVKRVFNDLDEDGDGLLSAAELEGLIEMVMTEVEDEAKDPAVVDTELLHGVSALEAQLKDLIKLSAARKEQMSRVEELLVRLPEPRPGGAGAGAGAGAAAGGGGGAAALVSGTKYA